MTFRRAIFRALAVSDISKDEVRSIPELGQLIKSGTVALMLESGIGFFVHLVALLSLGVPVVILSARLSTTNIQHLLQETDAHSIITSLRLCHDGLIRGYNVHFIDPFAIDLEFKGMLIEPAPVLENDCNSVIFHSSGTTGLPKAIRHPQRYLLAYAACHEFKPDEDVSSINVSTLPLYHGFGMLAPALSLSVGMPFCFPSAVKIPTAEYTVELLQLSSAGSLMTVPSILEDMCQHGDSDFVSRIKDLHFVAVGGGPMKSNIAEHLALRDVRLLNHFGATELGALAPIFRLDKVTDYDWRYLRIRRDLGLRLVPLDLAGIEEQQYYQLTATPVGQESDWSLKDLIQLREGKDRDIKILHRNDDIIVLSNGEKVMPQRLELALSELPGVKAALAFGSGRFEIGVLIEPTELSNDSLLNRIWEKIIQVNQETDSHAQVLGPDAIIILSEGRKFPRSDKGSIMRAEAYQLFKEEVEAMYNQTSTSSSLSTSKGLPYVDPNDLRESLRGIIQRYLPASIPWDFGDDVFEFGLDSLRAARVQRLLSSELSRLLGTEVQLPRFLYRNPTIDAMAIEIEAMLNRGSLHSHQQTCGSKEELHTFISQFRLSDPHFDREVHKVQRKAEQHVVLLTGSTGSIGAHLLARLLGDERVAEVICVDRPHPSDLDNQRQVKAFKKYRLATPNSGIWSKLTPIAADTKKTRLGTDEAVYAALASRVTHIIHNAWPMDFNRSVHSFRGQFEILHHLLQLSLYAAAQRHRPIRFVFHSSIAVLANYFDVFGDTGKVLELPVNDCRTTSQMGYAQAKWVCERIVENAAHDFSEHIDASIIRIGQISGSTHSGIWNEKEHVPTLLKMAEISGHLPRIEGTLSWLPVDIAAAAISDIVLSDGSPQLVYHVENPNRQNWNDVLEELRRLMQLPLDGDELAPFITWLDEFEKTEDSSRGRAALELMPFFREDFARLGRGVVVLDTKHASLVSSSLDSFGPVPVPLLERYVKYWKSIDFLYRANVRGA
ncbi:putative Carrier domain-containing protein [Seiridium cardinale]